MKKFALALMVTFAANVLSAQIISYKKEADGILFQLQNEVVKLFVCNDNIIRVAYGSENAITSKKSLIVNKEWTNLSFDMVENDTSYVISTSKLKAFISKSNAIISYYAKSGEFLLKEDSKKLTAKIINEVNTNTCAGIFNSPKNEALYGLGQHQQSIMNHKGKTQTLDQANMEIAIPLLVSNRGYGILWDNYSYTLFDGALNASTKYKFESESGDLVDYYFLYGPDADSIIAAYRTATGAAPLFPKWSYGLFQSMDKYEKSEDLYNVANKYRKNRIPVDCIVQDWDYWTPNPWGSHKMNTSKYPDPGKLIDSLHSMNLHAMISVWPIFTEGDGHYTEMSNLNALYPSSGTRHYYDPHNEQARDIYWRQVKENLFGKYGWDAWWADGDEPDNWPDAFNRRLANTAFGKGFQYYNTYPLMHTSAFYKGWRNDIPNKRLYTLSRCSFAGQQRNAAASWSGDIQSNWTDYKKQLSAGLNFCYSGVPYWTTDIGGYWGTDFTKTENRELFIRWFQYGAFCPIFRIHGKLERTLYSDLTWDAVTRNNLLLFDKLRYRLMPYIYSMAWKVTNEHYTIMRHLTMDFRNDANVANIDNQFMFGSSIMVNPIADPGIKSRQVYLPVGKWFDFWTGKRIDGGKTISAEAPLDKMPLFIKAGAVLPMGPEIEYANQSVDPIEIRVYRGADGSFVLYEDEGDTYNYEQGQYATISFSYNDAAKQLNIGARQGSFNNMLQNRTFKFVWVSDGYGVGLNSPVSFDTIITYNGTSQTIQFVESKFHPKSHYEAEEVVSVYKGFNGNGYVTGLESSSNATVKFTVSMVDSGSYVLQLRYAAALKDSNTNIDTYINDKLISSNDINYTGSWENWNTFSSMMYLKSGVNNITIKTDSAYITLDCIDFFLPDNPVPFSSSLKKNVRLKLQNTDLYLQENEGSITLYDKNISSAGQIWVLENEGGKYKISSFVSKKALTVQDSSLNDKTPVATSDYLGQPHQQWHIDDYGFGLIRLRAVHSNKTLSYLGNALEQDSDQNLTEQKWIMEDPATPGKGKGLLGEYYLGTNFGTLMYRKIDENVNFNWALGSPDATIPKDKYSVRWSGQILPQFTDEYTFYTKSDDGVRLWVNNTLIINDWTARAVTERSGKIKMEANKLYDIKLEYFEDGFDAIVSLEWVCPSLERQLIPQSQLFGKLPTITAIPSNGNGLKGEYFNGMDLLNSVLLRTDTTINFNWGDNIAGPNVSKEQYSVRWTGKLQPQFSEKYIFYSTSSYGFRLWVGTTLVINNWTAPESNPISGTINLQAGKLYDIKAEFKHLTGSANAQLEWQSVSLPRQIVPKSRLFSDPITGNKILENASSDEIKIFPNPSSNQLFVEFSLVQNSDIDIIIFDTMGKKLKSLKLSNVNPGIKTHKVDIAGLASGEYLMQLNTSRNSFSKSFLIQ